MVIHGTDTKNGVILSVGWAVLVAYIIAVYTWTDTSCDMSRSSLIWSRERANILLGVNSSVDPCEDIYNNSCDLYLQDSVGPFNHAALRSQYFIEQSDAYIQCSENAEQSGFFDDGQPRLVVSPGSSDAEWILYGSGEDDEYFVGNGTNGSAIDVSRFFMQDCAVFNLVAEIAPVNNTWRFVIDSLNGSSAYVESLTCLKRSVTMTKLASTYHGTILFGDTVCDNVDFEKGVECSYVTSCSEYVTTFFPETLSGYATIEDTTKERLVSMMHRVFNTTIPIHFGGGNFSVHDPGKQLQGAPVRVLREERKTRELLLLGSAYQTSWMMPGTEVNAYYTQNTDEVFIAGGLLVEPFYHKSYPFEHNLAGLGFVIAHEIGHSFGPRAAKMWGRKDTTDVVNELEANLTTLARHPGKGYGSELYADYRGAVAINELVRVPTELFFHHMAQTWCQRHQPWLDDPHPPSYWRVVMAFDAMDKFTDVFDC